MTTALASCPVAVRRAIEERLGENETVIWAGRPTLRHALASEEQPAPGERAPLQATSIIGRLLQESATVVLSLLLLPVGGAIGAYGLVHLRSAPDVLAVVGPVLVLLLGLGLVAAGLFGLGEPLRNRLQVVRTYYVLTDRRALILRQGNGRTARTIRAACALLASVLALALGVLVAAGGLLVLPRMDAQTAGTLGTFLFGAGWLFVTLGIGLLIGCLGWTRLTLAWASLVDAVRGDGFDLEIRAFRVDELDGREIRVKRMRRDGVGDLVFANGNYYDREGDETAGGGIVEVDVGFMSVGGARELEAMLRRVHTERSAA